MMLLLIKTKYQKYTLYFDLEAFSDIISQSISEECEVGTIFYGYMDSGVLVRVLFINIFQVNLYI